MISFQIYSHYISKCDSETGNDIMISLKYIVIKHQTYENDAVF